MDSVYKNRGLFADFLGENCFFQDIKIGEFSGFLDCLLIRGYEEAFIKIMEIIKKEACGENTKL